MNYIKSVVIGVISLSVISSGAYAYTLIKPKPLVSPEPQTQVHGIQLVVTPQVTVSPTASASASPSATPTIAPTIKATTKPSPTAPPLAMTTFKLDCQEAELSCQSEKVKQIKERCAEYLDIKDNPQKYFDKYKNEIKIGPIDDRLREFEKRIIEDTNKKKSELEWNIKEYCK